MISAASQFYITSEPYIHIYPNSNTLPACDICLEVITGERAEHSDGGEHHPFHVNCITEELTYKKNCPTCRKPIITLSSMPPIKPQTFCAALIGAITGIVLATLAHLDFNTDVNIIYFIPQTTSLIVGMLNGILCSELSDNKVGFIIAGLFGGCISWIYLSSGIHMIAE